MLLLFLANPLALGFARIDSGSHQELCRLQIRFIVVLCYPFKKSTKVYFVTSLLLARNFLLASLFSFQGAYLQPFARSDRNARSIDQTLRFDLTGGGYRTRTGDPLLAKQVLYQLSYTPVRVLVVGPSGLEPPTSRLSVVRSSQLSYGPVQSLTQRAPSKLNNVTHLRTILT